MKYATVLPPGPQTAAHLPPRQIELDDAAMSDVERPLNKRGRRDALEMGRRLAERGLLPDLILASHATRAWTTAEAYADRLGYPPDRIQVNPALYTATAASLLALVRARRCTSAGSCSSATTRNARPSPTCSATWTSATCRPAASSPWSFTPGPGRSYCRARASCSSSIFPRMSPDPLSAGPDRRRCRHFFITHEPKRPRGCRAYGFKCRDHGRRCGACPAAPACCLPPARFRQRTSGWIFLRKLLLFPIHAHTAYTPRPGTRRAPAGLDSGRQQSGP